MGGDVSGVLQEKTIRPKARNGAFSATPVSNGVEVGRICLPFQGPIQATPLSPESFLALKDPHQGIF